AEEAIHPFPKEAKPNEEPQLELSSELFGFDIQSVAERTKLLHTLTEAAKTLKTVEEKKLVSAFRNKIVGFGSRYNTLQDVFDESHALTDLFERMPPPAPEAPKNTASASSEPAPRITFDHTPRAGR